MNAYPSLGYHLKSKSGSAAYNQTSVFQHRLCTFLAVLQFLSEIAAPNKISKDVSCEIKEGEKQKYRKKQ